MDYIKKKGALTKIGFSKASQTSYRLLCMVNVEMEILLGSPA